MFLMLHQPGTPVCAHSNAPAHIHTHTHTEYKQLPQGLDECALRRGVHKVELHNVLNTAALEEKHSVGLIANPGGGGRDECVQCAGVTKCCSPSTLYAEVGDVWEESVRAVGGERARGGGGGGNWGGFLKTR